MEKIEVQLPEQVVYSMEIQARVSDLNYGGHVGHDSILTLMQEARVSFYNSLGFKDEVSIEGDVGQIIVDVGIQYKSEGMLGDIFVINIGLNGFVKYGFDMYYRILNKKSNKEIARGKTGILCFNYETKKVSSIPEIFLSKLKQSLNENS